MDCWCLLRCNIYEFSPWRLSSDHCRHLQLITLHSFNLDVFLFLTRGDRSEGIVKFHLDGCLLCCSHGLTPHCLSDQSWDEPIRTSDMTEVAHRRFTQNSATHVEPVHVSVRSCQTCRWLICDSRCSLAFPCCLLSDVVFMYVWWVGFLSVCTSFPRFVLSQRPVAVSEWLMCTEARGEFHASSVSPFI